MDIFIFSFLTNFIYFCVGILFYKKKKIIFTDCLIIFFTGIIFLSFLALFLNFFISLDKYTNSLLYFLLVILFIFNFKFEYFKPFIIFLLISSLLTFCLIFFSNVNRPDAGLYHLPFISILNENKIIFGINNIDSRFTLSSILQYLSAINFNFIFQENGIVIPLASVVSFFYIYFGYDVFNVAFKKKIPTISDFFSLFILIYIVYKINRYSGFGNDAVGHLSFFYIISYFLKNNINKINLKKLSLISVFTFTNKTLLIIVFLFPIFIFFYNKHYKIKKFISIFLSIPSLFLILWLIKNVIMSGCIIYPASETCFKKLNWTDISEVKRINLVGSAWAKAWPDKIADDLNMNDYNKNFNWIESWSRSHLKIIGKIIIPYIFILILTTVYLWIKTKKKLTNRIDKNKYWK